MEDSDMKLSTGFLAYLAILALTCIAFAADLRR
jgi:hypothetical protein